MSEVKHFQRVRVLLDQILEMDDAARDDWVQSAPRDEAHLYQEALALAREPTVSELDMLGVFRNDAPQQDHWTGQRIGNWTLIQMIGQGGMGSVWLAERADEQFKMRAAVKIIREEMVGSQLTQRFQRERQILANLSHPHIARLLDGGTTASGQPYLVMEYVAGLAIDQYQASRNLTAAQLVRLFLKICAAVAHAHDHGVVHRDIKPGNILVNAEGDPKLLDFGIARIDQSDGFQTLTHQNPMTPAYAAPEQLAGESVTPQCDIYSLALVLFYLLTGQNPRRRGRDPVTWLRMLLDQDQPIEDPFASQSPAYIHHILARILERALAYSPTRRYAAISEMIQDLESFLDGEAPRFTGSHLSSRKFDAVLWGHPDDADAISALAESLAFDHGLKVWRDGSEHNSAAFARALESCNCCIVVLGKEGQGPWQDAEMVDLLHSLIELTPIRFIPVLLPGAERPQRESDLPPFLRRRTWAILDIPYDPSALEQLTRSVKGLPPAEDVAPTVHVCPFRGLQSFREEDQAFFFGRDEMTQRLAQHMAKHRFLAALGPSGSGKSSVVQAGLAPVLRKRGYACVRFTPASQPLEELAFALAPYLEISGEDHPGKVFAAMLARDPESLHHAVMRYGGFSADKPLCLVIDQFEEVFTLARYVGGAESFFKALLHAVSQKDGPISAVLTMRSDFLGSCVLYPDLNNFLTEHIIQIGPMDREVLRSVIEEPALLAGLRFEDGLIDRILSDITDASGQLPLLEHALLELYERRRGRYLTMESYTQIGGVDGALAQRAESEYAALDKSHRTTLRKMFTLCLVRPGEGSEDTRRRARREELLAVSEQPTEVFELLNRWTNVRLLTGYRDEVRNVEMVDVSHEALIRKWSRIRTWMAEDRESARLLALLRSQAQTWNDSKRNQDLLPRGSALSRLKALDDRTAMGPIERDFLNAALDLSRTEKRKQEIQQQKELKTARSLAMRARIIAAITVLGLIIALALGFTARRQQAKAEREGDIKERVTAYFIGLFDMDEQGVIKADELTAVELIRRGAKKLEADRDLDDQPMVRANLLQNMGMLYFGLARFEQALPLHQQALDLFEKEGDFASAIKAANTIAEIHIEMGQFQQALAQADQAVSLARNHFEKGSLVADALFSQGWSLVTLGLNHQATPVLREALDHKSESGTVDVGMVSIQNLLANSLSNQGCREEAEHWYSQASAHAREMYGHESMNLASINNNLAFLYLTQNRFSEARELFEQTVEIHFSLRGSHPLTLPSLHNLVTVLLTLGEYEDAATYAERGLDIAWRFDHAHQRLYQLLLAYALAGGGHHQASRDIFMETLADASLSGSKAIREFHYFADFLCQTGAFEEAVIISDKARILINSMDKPGRYSALINRSISLLARIGSGESGLLGEMDQTYHQAIHLGAGPGSFLAVKMRRRLAQAALLSGDQALANCWRMVSHDLEHANYNF